MELAEFENVIFFDGICHLCSESMMFIARRDKKAIFRFCAIQSERGTEICRSIGIDPDDPSSVVVISEGKVRTSSDALLQIAEGLGGPWRIFTVCRLIPRPIRDWLYRLLANNRYRLFGKRDECLIGTNELRNRSIT